MQYNIMRWLLFLLGSLLILTLISVLMRPIYSATLTATAFFSGVFSYVKSWF